MNPSLWTLVGFFLLLSACTEAPLVRALVDGGATANPVQRGSASDLSSGEEEADAGVPMEPSLDAGVIDPFAAPSSCENGPNHLAEGAEMRPGSTCNGCHLFQVAGTVYPNGHAPDDCNGVDGGVRIVLTDIYGAVVKLNVNRAGNFHSDKTISAPFHVRVVGGGKERAMLGAPPNGDCNSCHSELGTFGAPGRILSP